MADLVSCIIPTRNSVRYLKNCLESIKRQTHPAVEIVIVDGKSTDGTIDVAKQYTKRIFSYTPVVAAGHFDATHKRNFGVKKAKGIYIYYIDTDMELPPNLLSEAVGLCKDQYDALIVPELSFGTGVWAGAKDLERRCYWGDKTIEAPRFVKRSVWLTLGGLDETLGSGRDDGDFYFKLLDNHHSVGRTRAVVRHNEGNPTLSSLFRKKVMYGKDLLKYIRKRPVVGVQSYMPIRMSFLRNWRLFLSRPFNAFFFFIMKTVESLGGIYGVLLSLISK